ncbi:hypothetical protein [Vibrio alginolyticus]|uniref:hypothetical protein n=1 Tax=Vibrio alginolyticus TaxID=663 RepID=UPI001E3F9449|nr:hypothetical protein [Vibrio alginolyticus]
MDACQFKKSIDEIKSLQWLAYVYGEQVTGSCYGDYGATRCELERTPSDSTLCTGVDSGQWTQNTICHGNFQFTGNQCEGGTLFWVKMALTPLLFLMTPFMTLTTQQATSKTLAYYLMAQPIR